MKKISTNAISRKALRPLAIGDLVALNALLTAHLRDCTEAHQGVYDDRAHQEIEEKAETWRRALELVRLELSRRELTLYDELAKGG